MRVIRSLLFYLAFYGGSIFYVLGAFAAFPFGARTFRAAIRAWSLFHRTCARVLLGITVQVDGNSRPLAGPVLYAMKHESFYEAIDLTMSLPEPGVFAKEELFRIPGWGRLGIMYGLVPVARERGASTLRKMLSAARRLTAEGRPLVIFPEGTRVPHGRPAPLQSGFAGLYKLVGLPVVPVAVNSGPLYHRRWKRGGTLIYRFGEPIPPGLPREEIEAKVLEAINALNT